MLFKFPGGVNAQSEHRNSRGDDDENEEMLPIWWKTFGTEKREYCSSAQTTFDGGYILAGTIEREIGGEKDIWLVKTNSVGIEEWNSTIDGGLNEKVKYIQETKDHGFIITGYRSSLTNNYNEVMLIKTNQKGEKQWIREYNWGTNIEGFDVKETDDEGFLITGRIAVFVGNYTYNDLLLIKTDSAGNTLWNRTFGGDGVEEGYSIVKTKDNAFLITGLAMNKYYTIKKVLVVKFNSSGFEIWNKTYGGESGYYYMGEKIIQTLDSGFIILAHIKGYTNLLKIDDKGNEIWNRTYGSDTYSIGEDILQLSNGNYAVTGSSWEDVWLLKTNSQGAEIWNKTYGGLKTDDGQSLLQTDDQGILIVGNSYSYGNGNSDFFMIRVNSNGSGGYRHEPVCVINSPYNGETVSGPIIISGTASDIDGKVTRVAISIYSEEWKSVTRDGSIIVKGTNEWHYDWDSNNFRDGEYYISATAEDDKGLKSNYLNTTIKFYIDNNNDPTDSFDNALTICLTIILVIVASIIILIVVIFVFLFRKKDKNI
jgi:hypothetical protein